MIITRAPYRVSFFGGGSDYKAHYLKHGGSVLGATLDKYCWVSVRPPTPFGPRFKIVYSRVEECDVLEEVEHPAVRECLRMSGYAERGCELHHWGDLPARSGVGSSSAFVVALLHALRLLSNQGDPFASSLANDAIRVEQDILGETVGDQDQWLIANGGLCKIDFRRDGGVACRRVSTERMVRHYCSPVARLEGQLLLFFTGVLRTSSDVAAGYVPSLGDNQAILARMVSMAAEGKRLLESNDPDGFGPLLDEAWELKKRLGAGITTPEVDLLYNKAKGAGAIGGKLLGAGGGGFLLLFVPYEFQGRVREALAGLKEVPVRFDYDGSTLVADAAS